ncbi:MAG: class I SAM-dependent methyltransferase [Phycisphaerae bacterium]|nr:class I SAM-dependent methyltransferase [Phycisphaerae bacterium]
MDFAARRDWPGYFRTMLGKPPRETLVRALEIPDRRPAGERLAVDLACGEGRDTLELLRRGWRVVALDGHPMAIELLTSRVPPDQAPLLTARVEPFEASAWPRCRLLNCSFALPFCEPREFPGLWRRIADSIEPGGLFAGQLFGDRDSWAGLPDRTHHRRGDLDGLFAGFLIEQLIEEERDDVTVEGEPKHWHVFHVVARKR